MEIVRLLQTLMYLNWFVSLCISAYSFISKKYSMNKCVASMTVWGIGLGFFISSLIVRYYQ